MKINSVEELTRLRESLQPCMRLRELGEATEDITDVSFLMGDRPEAEATRALMTMLCDWVEHNKFDKVRIRAVDRMETERAPAMKIVEPNGRTSVYVNLDADKLETVATEHLQNGEPVQAFLDR